MKRITFSLFLLLICISQAFSQDVIFKKNGIEIKCKIHEEGDKKVIYSKEGDESLTKISLSQFHIKKIVYGNGSKVKAKKPIPEIAIDAEIEFQNYVRTDIKINQQIGASLMKSGIWLVVNVVINSFFIVHNDELSQSLNNPENSTDDINDINDKMNTSADLQVVLNLTTLGFVAGNLINAGVKTKKKNRPENYYQNSSSY